MSVTDVPELEFKPATQAQADLRPWPRLLARMLDLAILSWAVTFAVVLGLMLATPALANRFLGLFLLPFPANFLSNAIGVAMALPALILLIAYGQTPGKWLFGIRVRDRDGRHIGFTRALGRELMVWAEGLGLGLPLVTLITTLRGYIKLTDDGITPWDRRMQCEVIHAPKSIVWWIKAVVGSLLVVVAIVYSYIVQLQSIFAS